jgi:chromosome segregation ATPase
VAVAMSGLAGFYAVVQLFINRRYDDKFKDVSSRLDECQEKHDDCTEQHVATLAKVARLEAEAVERDRRDREALEAKIAQLVKQNAEEREAKHDFRNALQVMQSKLELMEARARKRHGDDPTPDPKEAE